MKKMFLISAIAATLVLYVNIGSAAACKGFATDSCDEPNACKNYYYKASGGNFHQCVIMTDGSCQMSSGSCIPPHYA